jgi:hypothetical protein
MKNVEKGFKTMESEGEILRRWNQEIIASYRSNLHLRGFTLKSKSDQAFIDISWTSRLLQGD